MQIIGSKGHTFTPRFTESKSVKMTANMAAKIISYKIIFFVVSY